MNCPDIGLDINVTLGFDVMRTINQAKQAAADFVSAADPSTALVVSDVALAAEVPGVVVLAADIDGLSSYVSGTGDAFIVVANCVAVRTVRMSYS